MPEFVFDDARRFTQEFSIRPISATILVPHFLHSQTDRKERIFNFVSEMTRHLPPPQDLLHVQQAPSLRIETTHHEVESVD